MPAGIQSSRLWVRVLALNLSVFDLCWLDRVRTHYSQLRSSAESLAGTDRQQKPALCDLPNGRNFRCGDICPDEPSISRERSLPFVCKICGANKLKPASWHTRAHPHTHEKGRTKPAPYAASSAAPASGKTRARPCRRARAPPPNPHWKNRRTRRH